MGAFVVGAIAEFGSTHTEDSVTAFSTTPASYTITRDIDYMANVRARLGFTATPNTLVYASGGLAYAKLDDMIVTTNTANENELTGDEDSWGYAVGAGVEHLITDRISFGVEYLYQELEDNARVRLSRGTAPATNPFLLGNAEGTDFARSDDKFDLQSVRAVLNFGF